MNDSTASNPLIVVFGDEELRLFEGECVTFGRGGTVPEVDIVVSDDERVHRQVGMVEVGNGAWSLHNRGRWLTLRVHDANGAGFDEVPPGRATSVVWPESVLAIPEGDRMLEIRLTRPAPSAEPEFGAAPAELSGTATHRLELDRGTGYYRALVALCEPMLNNPHERELPTDSQIARRLNGWGRERTRINAKTVERRLDNCRMRLGLKSRDAVMGAGLEVRNARARLAEHALLHNFVTPADLETLDQD